MGGNLIYSPREAWTGSLDLKNMARQKDERVRGGGEHGVLGGKSRAGRGAGDCAKGRG